MSSSFQPEDPHPDARTPASPLAIITIAVVSALLVVMILALLAPRILTDYTNSWTITFGAGVLTLVVVLAIGFVRRIRHQARRRTGEEDEAAG